LFFAHIKDNWFASNYQRSEANTIIDDAHLLIKRKFNQNQRDTHANKQKKRHNCLVFNNIQLFTIVEIIEIATLFVGMDLNPTRKFALIKLQLTLSGLTLNTKT